MDGWERSSIQGSGYRRARVDDDDVEEKKKNKNSKTRSDHISFSLLMTKGKKL
jgi:hypothetical protein